MRKSPLPRSSHGAHRSFGRPLPACPIAWPSAAAALRPADQTRVPRPEVAEQIEKTIKQIRNIFMR